MSDDANTAAESPRVMKPPDIYTAYMYSYPHKTAYGKLENVDFEDYKGLLAGSRGSLYFHVPFCGSKCGYCNLFSVAGRSEEYMESYIIACKAQMEQYDAGLDWFSSLTLGGGDPCVLPPKQLYGLLSIAGGSLDVNVEISPNETTPEKLAILEEFNTRRVSIGVQSFVDSELDSLMRPHSAGAARRALNGLKSKRFPAVNIDLIYGIPGQTAESFLGSLRSAAEFEPDEIFIYPLYIRPGTELCGRLGMDQRFPNNDRAYEMYWPARDYLCSAGYTQISMRHFVAKAPETPESCGFENMLAIGCGGRSYIGNLHFCRPFTVREGKRLRIIDDFIKGKDKTEIRHGYVLNNDELRRRFVIKNLLHCAGVSCAGYQGAFGSDIAQDFPLLENLISDGYALCAKEDNGVSAAYKLTPLGLSLSDYIGPMFISKEVKERMARENS